MNRALTCLLLGAAGFVLSVPTASAYEWTITNNSKWAIHEIHISACNERNWGPDRMGSDIMYTGDSYVLHDVDAGCYDVLFVDQDGDKCDVRGVHVRGDWETTITSQALVACEQE
jgi:hypothetical protein